MAETAYQNLDSLVWLLGCANEARLVIEGVKTMTLVDIGSQISALTEGFCMEMGLKILPLRNLIVVVLCLKGNGGHFNTIQRIHRC